MASNFSFFPMSLTTRITAGPTSATGTFWLVNYAGGSSTLAITGGSYPPNGFRIVNFSPNVAYLTFCPSGQTASVAVTTGMPLLPQTVETFRVAGQNVIAYIT